MSTRKRRKRGQGAACLELRARNKHLQALGLWQMYEDYSVHDTRDSGVTTSEVLILARRHSQNAFKETQGVLLVNGKNGNDVTLDMLANFKFVKGGFSQAELKTVHRKCAIRHHKRLEDLRLTEVPQYVPLSTRVPLNTKRVADGQRLDRATVTSHGYGPSLTLAQAIELGHRLESETLDSDGGQPAVDNDGSTGPETVHESRSTEFVETGDCGPGAMDKPTKRGVP